MRIWLVILSAVTIASSAYGADRVVRVKAGEHSDYSRIVIPDNGGNIEFQQSGRTIRIRNLDASATLDLREINDERKAFRILSAKQSRGASGAWVELTINCDCTVRASRLGNQKFVLDVVDSQKTKSQIRPNDQTSSASRKSTTTDTGPTIEDRMSVEQAHNRMVALLKKAADEGLITITDTEGASENIGDPAILLPPATVPVEDANKQAIAHGTPNKKATEAMIAEQQSSEYRCLADAALHIDGEAFDADPLVEIADLQSMLADAKGEEEKEILHKLAAGFMSVGFGEEALALLKDYGEGKSFRADIARAISERPFETDSRLIHAKNCAGAHALWQAVVSEPRQAVRAYKRSSGAIKTLPSRLKNLIATRLAMKMIDAAAWEESEELFNIASAETETLGPELKYIQARLTEHNGDADASREALLEIASENSGASDDALLALADSYVQHGSDPHEGFKEDVGALAKTVGSPRAAFSEAVAWADIGNIDAAIMLLGNEASKSPELLQQARASAVPILKRAFLGSDQLSKISALDAFLAHKSWLNLSNDEIEFRRQIADTAFEFGLPNLALEILEDGPKQSGREYILAKASAALAAGQADEAIIISAPYTADYAFGEILVKANIEKNEYHSALAAAASLSDEDAKATMTARAGWLAKAWQSATLGFKSIDPSSMDEKVAAQYAFSAYMNGETSLPAAADAALSQQSSTIRGGLQSLFSTNDAVSALERSRNVADGVTREVLAFRELLKDG